MKSIIVGTDFSEGSYVALELAIDVANRMMRDIIVVWARREKLLFSNDQIDVMSNLAEDKLKQLCDKYQPMLKSGTITWRIKDGRVSSVLDNIAKEEEATLIVIGTNGASGFEKYFMGSTAVRIIQDSPCPVLCIRQGFDFHKSLERIVVPIRVNPNSRQKVAPAATMAKIFGSEVCLLGLLEVKDEEAALRTYISQSIDYLGHAGVPYNYEIRTYSSYCDMLLAYAEEVKADLVVINTEQDRIISQFFLGTNAQQIVHNSQIPVLCIHPADYINVIPRI